MIIDGHQHVCGDVCDQIKTNSAAGIDRVVLFPTLVHPERARNPGEFLEEMGALHAILSGDSNPDEARARSIAELTAKLKTAPDCFLGFGSVPHGLDYRATGEWIEKHIIGNSLRGIGEAAPGAGKAGSLEPILRYVQESGKNLPVWVHTFNPLGPDDIMTIVSLAEKYPAANVILGHGGGSGWTGLFGLVRKSGNVYIDISASFTIFSIRYLSEAFPERTVFSSDFPYGDPEIGIRQVEKAVADPYVRQRVLGLNTKELLGI